MRVSYKWLNEWIDLSGLSAEETAEALTMGGVEVEEVVAAAPEFSGVVVAKVLDAKPHPNADRLRVAAVDAGLGEPVSIVCGAPNCTPGITVPCALPGARMPDGTKIKKTKMRGEPSGGMLCSARELGLSTDHSGLMVLPDGLKPGADFRQALALDDKILDFKITPNRPDCLSVKGVARELGALTGRPLKAVRMAPVDPSVDDALPSDIQAPHACGRFVTRVVRGVDPSAPTPDWMRARLESSGLRSVGFLVDVGNYVMLELGQPLHIFDRSKVGSKLIPRFAKTGEKLECINGKTVELDPTDLVIADENNALSVAGIMGGQASAVDESTSSIAIESAFFFPSAIMGKSRKHGFATDSSYRFERGVDRELQTLALERATRLILDGAGGQAGPVCESLGDLPPARKAPLRYARVAKVLGVEVEPKEIDAIFGRLGFSVEKTADGLVATEPSFRFDIGIEEDLIEEVARVRGYSKIPFEAPEGRMLMLPARDRLGAVDEARRAMAAMGYQEVVNFPFSRREWEADFYPENAEPIALANPMQQDAGLMRSGLVPGLLQTMLYNVNRKQESVRIFELALGFDRYPKGAEREGERLGVSFRQRPKIAALSFGPTLEESWALGKGRRAADFFDAKGEVERLLMGRKLRFEPTRSAVCHPGRGADVWLWDESARRPAAWGALPFEGEGAVEPETKGKGRKADKGEWRKIGFVGQLHPALAQKYGVKGEPVVFELLADVFEAETGARRQDVPNLPPARRDLALTLDESVTYGQFEGKLLGALREADKEGLVGAVRLFDVFKGGQLPQGKKSFAVAIDFEPKGETLRDDQIDAIVSAAVRRLAQDGLELRA